MKTGKNLNCEWCQNTFYVAPHRLRKNKTHTCSMICAAELNKSKNTTKIESNCVVCDKKIRRKASQHNKNKGPPCCSRKCRGTYIETHYMGDNNPNKSYKVDESFFEKIDTEQKAYFLGWIASDGHVRKNGNGIVISIHKKDGLILETLSKFISDSLPIKNRKGGKMVSLTINSKKMNQDVCRALKIKPGKKSYCVGYPDLPSNLHKHFIRGVFDGDGSVCAPSIDPRPPRCNIASGSKPMIDGLFANIPVRTSIGRYSSRLGNPEYKLDWWGNNCLDFLSWIYDGATYRLARKHDIYWDISMWVPGLSGKGRSGDTDKFHWIKTDASAVPPTKVRASDSGYDITIIKKVKDLSEDVALYDSGIKVQPFYGWYFMLVGRSSISKTGYQLANCVGVIDRTYTGTVLVALRKMDLNVPDLTLPIKIAQIVPMPIVHFEFEEVEEFSQTDRSSGGFGSTDSKGK